MSTPFSKVLQTHPSTRWVAPCFLLPGGKWIRPEELQTSVSPWSATSMIATEAAPGRRRFPITSTTIPTGPASAGPPRKIGGILIWCSHDQKSNRTAPVDRSEEHTSELQSH